jgi:lysozyme
MLSNDEIIQRLVLHEGVSLKCYRCSRGYLTIGVGRNLETNPLTNEELKVCGDYKHGITKNAAFYLLRNDIARVVDECKKKISFWSQLDNERQYALIDMVFQLGLGGVLKFKNMLKAMGVGNYKEAAEHCLDSKYAVQTPNRAKRIAKTIECGRFEI